MSLQILGRLALFVLFSSCYSSTPEDITDCVGSDVNIPWEYPDSAGINIVSWDYIDSSNVATTILVQAAGSAATVIGGYNIQHNTNGDVTITAATVANSGTYRITVLYTSATPTLTDDVVINVYDPPTDFNFTESHSGSQKTFTCITSSLGEPAANLYIQVNGKDNTTSKSATVSGTVSVKCFLSGPCVQCMSGVSGTVTSINVQLSHLTIAQIVAVGVAALTAYILLCICLLCLCAGGVCGICLRKKWKPKPVEERKPKPVEASTTETTVVETWSDEKGNSKASTTETTVVETWSDEKGNSKGSCCNCYGNYECESCTICVSKNCAGFKFCYMDELPSWYQILWYTVFGIPFVLGFLLTWKVSKKELECYNCHQVRHISKECPLKEADQP